MFADTVIVENPSPTSAPTLPNSWIPNMWLA